jgi:hypothetical protein
MKQKNILEGAAEILGLQETSFPILRRCANLVLANIATNHRDCLAQQTFNVTDGKIEYKNFNKTFLRVKSVSTGTYSLFIDFMHVPNGRVEVKYFYIPSFSDNLEESIHIPNLAEKTFVYGVAVEYALISGMFNEAKVWNERFESGLFATNEKNKRLKIRAPRW